MLDPLETMLGLTLAVWLCLGATPASSDEAIGAPDTSAILEQARIAEERVVYAQDFEGPEEVQMVHFYRGGRGDAPNTVVYSGPTEDEAFTGSFSYQISLTFEPDEPPQYGASYFLLPVEIPAWSDLTLRWRIKAVVPPGVQLHPFHGFTGGDLEAAEGHNVAPYVGHMVDDAEGWEKWEATARSTGKVGERVQGAALYFQISGLEGPTTVTFYVDDVTITGRLPVNWEEIWADASRYFREFAEVERRASAARRLAQVVAWRAEIEQRRPSWAGGVGGSALLQAQYAGTVAQVEDLLAQADTQIAAVQAGLADEEQLFTANINAPERLIFEARRAVGVAEACLRYAAAEPSEDFLRFTLDPTQSYPILPTGPGAMNEESSYYSWTQAPGTFENPQILPETDPVPAEPGTTLSNSGCRGLFVPFGFAVRAGRDLNELVFLPTDLTSAQGVIPASAVDLRVLAPWYRPFGGELRLMNEPLLRDPQFAVPVVGEQRNVFKDPRYGNDAPRLLPVTIPAGTNRQFYALVRVPEDAPPGVYRGAIEGSTAEGLRIAFDLQLEVLPFDLEPTPYAYSAFYRSYLADEETKLREGLHSWRKTDAQMEAELVNMAEHGMNTLNLYSGGGLKTDEGWDFSELDMLLGMAQRAGLTRSPFTWLGHNLRFIPDTRPQHAEDWDTWEKVYAGIEERVQAVNEFCRERGYPQPAFFGHDERSGEELAQLRRGYQAVNDAGGIVTVACYSDYWANVGTAMTLPIVYGGARSASARHAIRQTQAAGLEAWIYNDPCTNLPATPSVYRRRYGLGLWVNQEDGAVPWEYSGTHYTEEGYVFEPDTPVYAFAFPTWSGEPIDSIIFEAFREGVYDTRYMATLEKHLSEAQQAQVAEPLTSEIEAWLEGLCVNEDLQQVRRRMVDYILALRDALR